MKEQQYPPPKQVPNNLKLHMEETANVKEINNVPQEDNTTDQLRRSRRLPRASNKYLKAIKAELQD